MFTALLGGVAVLNASLLVTQKTPLELARKLVVLLAPVTSQVRHNHLLGRAPLARFDRIDPSPPERAAFPRRSDEGWRKQLQGHGRPPVCGSKALRSNELSALSFVEQVTRCFGERTALVRLAAGAADAP